MAAAVAILVSLSLVFGAVTAQWASSTAADVQAVADAGALAGMNVVAGYAVVAQLLDALVLSMGLVGLLTLAIGVVVCAIPVVDAAGPPILSAAKTVFDARLALSKSAARGLSALERAVPYLVAANSYLTIRANAGANASYVGLAIPYPHEGSSDFGDLDTDGAADGVLDALEGGKAVDALEKQAAEARERADEAFLRGWANDCGNDVCMRERATALAGMAGASNPGFPAASGWDFGIPILRARAYYAQRLAMESPADASVAELTRSCARSAFYAYAYEQVCASSFTNSPDGEAVCDLRPLPANTDEVRGTTLYTDPIWYCSDEGGRRVIHASPACPGAAGAAAGYASVADEESGACGECPVCRFTVVDIGRAPAASTSIDNGFEHYWREVVRASNDYEGAMAQAAELERQAQEHADRAAGGFAAALAGIKANRVELSPPGRYGCVCVVADTQARQSGPLFSGVVGDQVALPARMAVSASVLARDDSSSNAGVLGEFFDSLVGEGPVGVAGDVLDQVMTTWGGLIASYGDGYEAFMGAARTSFERLSEMGMGRVSEWLKGALADAIELTGVRPADLSVKKPVLVNTSQVMEKAGNNWYGAARALVSSMYSVPAGATPREILAAIGVFLESYQGSTVVTVAEFEIPGTGVTVPIEIDLAWLAEQGAA